jgi:hypothetical protein
MPARTRAKLTIKTKLKLSSYPHTHFTKHLVGVFGKQPFKHKWN